MIAGQLMAFHSFYGILSYRILSAAASPKAIRQKACFPKVTGISLPRFQRHFGRQIRVSRFPDFPISLFFSVCKLPLP